MRVQLKAEFTVYPFEEGEAPPQHVQAAIDEVQKAGLAVDVGLLGQVVTGDSEVVLEALRAAEGAAVAAGATRIVVSLEVEP